MKHLQVDGLSVGDRDGQHLRFTANEIIATDAHRQTRAHLLIERGGSPVLELCDGNGTPRVIVQVHEDGCPSFTLRDGNHTLRLELELEEDEGAPSLTFYDRSGDRAFVLARARLNGRTELREVDGAGKFVPWVPASEATKGQPHAMTKES